MSLVRGLETFTILTVLISSVLIVLSTASWFRLLQARAARLGSWGLGLAGLVSLTGGLGGGEYTLAFGGLCLLCLAIGMETPAAGAS
jgi:hypothetical protein